VNRPHLISRILYSSDCRDRNDLKTRRIIYSFIQSNDANAGGDREVLDDVECAWHAAPARVLLLTGEAENWHHPTTVDLVHWLWLPVSNRQWRLAWKQTASSPTSGQPQAA